LQPIYNGVLYFQFPFLWGFAVVCWCLRGVVGHPHGVSHTATGKGGAGSIIIVGVEGGWGREQYVVNTILLW